ncbi:MAG: hypothetical protein ACLFVU_08100 [Phycisphaerae bacterium]
MTSPDTIASKTWRMLALRGTGKDMPQGLDAAWDSARALVQKAVPRTKTSLKKSEQVLALESELSDLTDARLREAAADMRAIFRRGREKSDDLTRAFALVREVAFRQIGLKAHPVQVAAAMALERGCVIEFATGEGKTLSATMPATIAGWRGQGVHVLTTNDYLARRDAESMSSIYNFCGCTVKHVEGQMDPAARREAYAADITYGTNKEMAADFLRDRLALGRLGGLSSALLSKLVDGAGQGTDRIVQRGLAQAIVDEADSVLIDEAVTPLIISGDAPNEEQVQAYIEARAVVHQLQEGEDYTVTEKYREIDLTRAGEEKLAQLAEPFGGVWAGARRREELAVQALTARHFYRRGQQYIVDDGKIVIVDDFTGRLMPDRTWRDGMHQAIEAKEDLEVNPAKDTFARISFQRFFRMYGKLSGMTGTAAEAWREFWQMYNMPLVRIPSNKPCIRRQLPDRVFATEQAKFDAIVDRVAELHEQGRPVLLGTRSVHVSEDLADRLRQRGMQLEVLNATNEAREAQIVAEAGKEGRITVATNLAGRGTDIKLGRGVAEKGGLAVVASERHESGRIDRQLFGRSGRQGDPGTAEAFVSLEDELVRRYASGTARALRKRYGTTGREITSLPTRRVFTAAQRKAEAMSLRQRKGVLKTDDWLEEYLGFAGKES